MKLIIFYFDYKVAQIFKEKTDAEGNSERIITASQNFVYRNEIVAKIVDVEEQNEIKSHLDSGYNYYHIVKYIPFKTGEGIDYDNSTQTYRATEYGFVRIDRVNKKINLIRPLQIPREKTKAYFLICPTKFKKIPNYDDISAVLSSKNIHSAINRDKLEEQLNEIDINNPVLNKIIVAQGKEAINGYPEYFVPLIDIGKKAGKILEDGSIDFKEIESIIQVKERQAILKKIPAKEPIDGNTIYGDNIKAIVEPRSGYIKGLNIGSVSDDLTYVSLIDGCLNVSGNVISILPVAVIHGDVDYDSGNIDFNGSVEIFGSVLPGFTVKANDDITIRNNVDDAIIKAGGNVVVLAGIGGKGSTKIYAGGFVKAKYILNSTIEAEGDIIAEVSIINSNVYSNDKIKITGQNGKILGGEAMALHEITTFTSGGPKENKTILTVGKSQLIERELNKMKMVIDTHQIEVDELTAYIKSMYGENLFINTKEVISILPPLKKNNCILLLEKLANCNKNLQKVTEEYNMFAEKNIFKQEPVIKVFNEVFPGTVINIKKRTKNIDRKYSNSKFFEDNEAKIIKFTYAM